MRVLCFQESNLQFRFPYEIKQDGIHASYSKRVLSVRIPAKDQLEAINIEVVEPEE